MLFEVEVVEADQKTEWSATNKLMDNLFINVLM